MARAPSVDSLTWLDINVPKVERIVYGPLKTDVASRFGSALPRHAFERVLGSFA